MNVVSHQSSAQLQNRYRMEMDARLACWSQGIYLAQVGQSCPEIMAITGAARQTVQQWVAKYNRGGLDELFDKLYLCFGFDSFIGIRNHRRILHLRHVPYSNSRFMIF
jgi:hypothetical protein